MSANRLKLLRRMSLRWLVFKPVLKTGNANRAISVFLCATLVLSSCAPKSQAPEASNTAPAKDPQVQAIEEFFGTAVELNSQVEAVEDSVTTNGLDYSSQADIENIISSLSVTSVTPSIHVKVGPIVEHFNQPEEKFLTISQIIAASRALQALQFHRALSGTYSDIQLSQEVKEFLKTKSPNLAKYQNDLEAQPDLSVEHRESLKKATVSALIWKADEIGALAERLAELNEEMLKLHYEMPNIPDAARAEADKKQEALSTSVFSLRVEIDRRLAEQSAFVYLTWPIRVSGMDEPVSFYVFIREKLTEIAKSSADGKIQTSSLQFKALEAEIEKLMYIHHPTIQTRLVEFINALVISKAGGIAPLASARYEALDIIQETIENLSKESKYVQGQPSFEDFEAINAQLEKDFGFRDGEYNDYTETNLVKTVVGGLVAAELSYYASKVAVLQGANAAIKQFAANGMKRVLENQQLAKQLLAQGAKRSVVAYGAYGAATTGRFVAHVGLRIVGSINPIILVGSSLPLVYDGYKYYAKRQYRAFLKTYVPASQIAGLNSSAFARFATNVDDSIAGLYYFMESVATVYLSARFAGSSWLIRGKSAVTGTGALVSGLVNIRTVGPAFFQNHIKGLMLTAGYYVKNPAQLARATGLFLGRQLAQVPFIFGSITMAMDVHWKIQGYGLKGYDGIFSGLIGVLDRSVLNSNCQLEDTVLDFIALGEVKCSPSVMWSEIVRQYRNAFVDSPQASTDVASIAISDAVLAYGAASEKLSSIQLGHLYAWVSAASDISAQILVHTYLAEEGEKKDLPQAFEQIQWGRVLIHYAMVSTFSTWKMLYFYKPVIEGGTGVIKNGLVRQLQLGSYALRKNVVKTSINDKWKREGIRRSFNRHSVNLLQHSSVIFARYTSSLLSNWIGNAMFIYVALVLKSNSTDVPPALTPEVIEQMKKLFSEQGLEFTLDNIRSVTNQMREVSKDLKEELKHKLDTPDQEAWSL